MKYKVGDKVKIVGYGCIVSVKKFPGIGSPLQCPPDNMVAGNATHWFIDVCPESIGQTGTIESLDMTREIHGYNVHLDESGLGDTCFCVDDELEAVGPKFKEGWLVKINRKGPVKFKTGGTLDDAYGWTARVESVVNLDEPLYNLSIAGKMIAWPISEQLLENIF